jgi:cyclic-di-GMP-binding protein
MPSFDVVSKVEWSEVQNALLQAQKEVGQRFDFRGTETSLEKIEEAVLIEAGSEDRAKAALEVLKEKLIRRKVSLKYLDVQDPTKGPKGSTKILVKIKEGIESEKAKAIVKLIKDSKIKVQAAIQEQAVRVSGKKKDDLQGAIRLLKTASDLDIELQFVNFRD